MEHKHVKKLYRSGRNRMVSGVLAGVGEYTAVDATVIRVVYLLVAALTGVVPLALLYLVLALVVPQKPHDGPTYDETGKRIY